MLSLTLGLGLTACGDDADDAADDGDAPVESESTTAPALTEAELAAQYCASVVDIEAYAESLFAELGEDPTIEEQLDAEREVVAYIEEQGYDQLELPSEMAEDFRLFFEGFKEKLASPTPVEPSLEAQAAEQRLLEWEAANCTD